MKECEGKEAHLIFSRLCFIQYIITTQPITYTTLDRSIVMPFCSACQETYETRDRLCPICGDTFPTTPASSSSNVAATTSLLPLLPHEIIQGQQQPGDQQQQRTPEEQMQYIAQRLRELLIQGGFLGGAPGDDEDLEAWLMNNGGADGEGGGAAPGRRKNGLKDEEIARLPVSQLHATSTMLLSVTLKVVGGGEKELTVEAIPADFSPVPPDGGKFALVVADPLTAHELPLRNQAACAGKVLVTKRGKKTFAAMAKEAGRIGARGCVVLNSLPIWPYTMKDSKGEAKEVHEKYGDVFIMMVSQKDGEELLERIEGRGEGGGVKNEEDNHNHKNDDLVAHLAVSSVEKDCVICVCAFVEGEEILRLPCSHVYHADCCRKWLALSKTCPYCRHEVKAPRG